MIDAVNEAGDARDVVIRVDGVSKDFVIRKEKSLKERLVNFGRSRRHREQFHALAGVSFEIRKGDTVGLVGKNGSGKSTLLKVIGGIIAPSHGRVLRKGRLAALLELGAGFHPDLTGRENVYLNAALLGLKHRDVDRIFDRIVEFAGVGDFIDTQVKFYSSGMYVRLAFAVAVHVDPEILLVDEVLAVGDEPFQRKCMDKIRAFQAEGKTIVIVSHSLEQVGELCNRVLVLDRGLVSYDGDPGEGIRVLREGFEADRHQADRQQADVSTIRNVRIAAVAVGLGPGRDQELLHPGEPMRIEVELDSDVRVDDIVVGVGIETPLGQIVFGTNTERLDVPAFGVDAGSHRVAFDLGAMHLGQGQYFVHASFGTVEEGELFRVPQAASFEVETGDRNAGVVASSASVTIS
ncbi:MAG: ABC transporter ATP-binding protein [Protaetiibacter sp.]